MLTPKNPTDILSDSVDGSAITNPFTGETAYIRKGTIAAMLANVALLNKSISTDNLSPEEDTAIATALQIIDELVLGLRVSGMFALFDYIEWLQLKSPHFWGRICVGLLALRQTPKEITPEIRAQLDLLTRSTPPQIVMEKLLTPLLKQHGNQ